MGGTTVIEDTVVEDPQGTFMGGIIQVIMVTVDLERVVEEIEGMVVMGVAVAR